MLASDYFLLPRMYNSIRNAGIPKVTIPNVFGIHIFRQPNQPHVLCGQQSKLLTEFDIIKYTAKIPWLLSVPCLFSQCLADVNRCKECAKCVHNPPGGLSDILNNNH